MTPFCSLQNFLPGLLTSGGRVGVNTCLVSPSGGEHPGLEDTVSDQPTDMPPSTRAPLDPWPSQQTPAPGPEADEPFGPQEAGPDEPLDDWETPVKPPAPPGSARSPSSR